MNKFVKVFSYVMISISILLASICILVIPRISIIVTESLTPKEKILLFFSRSEIEGESEPVLFEDSMFEGEKEKKFELTPIIEVGDPIVNGFDDIEGDKDFFDEEVESEGKDAFIEELITDKKQESQETPDKENIDLPGTAEEANGESVNLKEDEKQLDDAILKGME